MQTTAVPGNGSVWRQHCLAESIPPYNTVLCRADKFGLLQTEPLLDAQATGDLARLC